VQLEAPADLGHDLGFVQAMHVEPEYRQARLVGLRSAKEDSNWCSRISPSPYSISEIAAWSVLRSPRWTSAPGAMPTLAALERRLGGAGAGAIRLGIRHGGRLGARERRYHTGGKSPLPPAGRDGMDGRDSDGMSANKIKRHVIGRIMALTIGVPRETLAGEKRVATVPEVVEKLIKLGFAVAVESGAGDAANCRRRQLPRRRCQVIEGAAACGRLRHRLQGRRADYGGSRPDARRRHPDRLRLAGAETRN
jgi:hypothetical protein